MLHALELKLKELLCFIHYEDEWGMYEVLAAVAPSRYCGFEHIWGDAIQQGKIRCSRDVTRCGVKLNVK